jgi:hypothetical protein
MRPPPAPTLRNSCSHCDAVELAFKAIGWSPGASCLGLRVRGLARACDPGGFPGARIWAVVVVTLYFPCRWFAELKAKRKDWWLSYL